MTFDERVIPFVRGQVLRRGDVQVAASIGRLADEEAPDVLLAIALAVRAPRHGHVCAELDGIEDQLVASPDADGPPIELAWPDPDRWLGTLRASPAVRGPDDTHVSPLVLDGTRLYLDRYWRYQTRLLERVRRRVDHSEPPLDLDRLRSGLDRWFPTGAEGLDRQRLGAVMAVLRRLTVISGGPGTGKTTTITRILALLLEQAGARGESLRVALAAPTGKAANRVKESIDEELERLELDEDLRTELVRAPSFTLHRLLGYRPQNPSRFRHDAENPLPFDVVVVDEASMVSFAMMAKLVEAVPEDTRLILLGDRDQLASVEAGAVLGDLCNPRGGELRFSRDFASRIESILGEELSSHVELVDEPGIWDCMVQLDRFFRFGEASGIGGVARAIQSDRADDVLGFLRGERTESGQGRYEDVELIELRDEALPDSCRQLIVDGYRPYVQTALGSEDGEDALDALEALRVLCAHRRGPLGVETLNGDIERWLASEIESFEPHTAWYVGRPVLVTENDYGLRLFNGDVGVVVRSGERRVVAFRRPGGGVRLLSPARLPPCETVFAMSIHKSQGSQFGHAVVVLPPERSQIVTRELVYTGVTRARDRASVVATAQVLREAIAQPVRRASGLRPQLWPNREPEVGPTPPTSTGPAHESGSTGQLSLF